jgi:cytochrome c-type biogenesis protein CcmH/NrfF
MISVSGVLGSACERGRRKAAATALWFAIVCGTAPVALAQSQADGDRAHQIGAKLKCMCSGCAQSAGGCYHTGGEFSGPCDTAKGMLKDISTRVQNGESEEQILKAFESKYGLEVYMEPPKRGFSLLAWVMPVVYLVVGTILVLFVISRWSKRPQAAEARSKAAISPEHLARARAQAARETDD